MTTERNETANTLASIREQIIELLDDAAAEVRVTPERASAEAYWIAHMRTALGGSEYRTHATTMLDTIHALTEGGCAECGVPVDDEDDELCRRCRRHMLP